MSNTLLKQCASKVPLWQCQATRCMSTVPAERKADFFPRVISQSTFPDIETLKLRRGTGGRSSFSGMIVTVFGATGFLARPVVNGLAKIGSQIIAPYRGDTYMTKDLKLAGDLGQVLFVPFSLRDVDSIYRAMKYSNVVVNLIGKGNETTNFDFESIHVEGARTIARIARESGVKRLVHVSALNSSPNPKGYYLKSGSKWLKSKYYGELAVREEFPEATIIRPADIYGELDSYLWYYCRPHRRRLRRLALPNGGYGITKTPVYGSDVAAGIVNAISDEATIGQTFDAVGPRRYELRELMLYVNAVIDKTKDQGFKVTNLDWDFLMQARISLFTNLKGLYKYPRVCWEMAERETVSDEKPSNPTLADLGVRLHYVEDKFPEHLKIFRFNDSYRGNLGETGHWENPRYIAV